MLKNSRQHARNIQAKPLLLALALVFIVFISAPHRTNAQNQDNFTLPSAQPHPLPQQLVQWDETKNGQGDYFDQVKSTRPGFLIWSHGPIRVYIAALPPGTLIKPEIWQAAIAQAVQDWQPYLPLSMTVTESDADIYISANPPKARSGERVRSAETRFELYVSDRQTLAHRMRIYIRPSQTPQYVSAAARHELGHALGIWGHSQVSTDVMYFAQVRVPPQISARDINTLKQIYQQPTQLGWSLVPTDP
jgi:predicted Zn-dependent protease